MPTDNGQFLGTHIPRAQLLSYGQVGHLPPIETPESSIEMLWSSSPESALKAGFKIAEKSVKNASCVSCKMTQYHVDFSCLEWESPMEGVQTKGVDG